jgi:hypothetical protein
MGNYTLNKSHRYDILDQNPTGKQQPFSFSDGDVRLTFWMGKTRSTVFWIEQQVGIDWSTPPGDHGSLSPINNSNSTAQAHGAA